MLHYGEPLIMEVLKNALPLQLYWVLFLTKNLSQEVETSKQILIKKKLDKQLTVQGAGNQLCLPMEEDKELK